MNPPIWNATLIKKLRSATNRSPHWPYDVWHGRLFYQLCFLNLASWRWQKGCGGHILSVPQAVVITYSTFFCTTRYMISQHPTSRGKGRGGGTDSSIWILVIIVGVFCLVDKLRNETIAYLGCWEIGRDSMKSKKRFSGCNMISNRSWKINGEIFYMNNDKHPAAFPPCHKWSFWKLFKDS